MAGGHGCATLGGGSNFPHTSRPTGGLKPQMITPLEEINEHITEGELGVSFLTWPQIKALLAL